MKTIKKIDDIRYKDFKKVQDIMLNIEKASTEDMLKAFKVLYDVSDEEAKNIKWEEVSIKIGNVLKIMSVDTPLVTKFESDGIVYGFVPKFDEISTGELIDLDNLLVDKNFEAIASILYRPIIKEDKAGKYEIEKYKGYDEKIFENAPINFYLGFINFFYKSYQSLKRHFLISMTNQQMKEKKTLV